jgi:deoxyribodipyrimidine photolyase-related protein
MTTLRFVLGDQLSSDSTALRDLDPRVDIVLIAEVMAEATYVSHHKQKLVFFFSAMRHFAHELSARGITVDYVRLDDPANTGSLSGELTRAVKRHGAHGVVVTAPGEWRVLQMLEAWNEKAEISLEIREDTRFLASDAFRARWFGSAKPRRMEFFYRDMRRETGLLMEGDVPCGGRWNFDAENRRKLPRDAVVPTRLRVEPDATTREVIELVGRVFPDNIGEIAPFGWAVDRAGALEAFEDFIEAALSRFGDYQDAMKAGAPFVHHAVISPYLNVGLLTAHEVCARVEAEYRQGRVPLNAAEGFIRQILGWREYVRGIYWSQGPGYGQSNVLDANTPLPGFYWDAQTDMNCLHHAIGDTLRHAYSHHIQRLMVTGNFALLAGIRPAEIEEWYLAVYADAIEWVELPNTHGMAIYADGGLLASKPYAASGAYINRMSDFCKGCRFDVRKRSGPDACPFNFLYWAFLLRNQKRLRPNPRLAMSYRTLAARPFDERRAIVEQARSFLSVLAGDEA